MGGILGPLEGRCARGRPVEVLEKSHFQNDGSDCTSASTSTTTS